MEYVYAALLLDAAGKEVTEQGLMEVIKASGLAPDEARAKAMVASLKGVNIKDVIKNAQSMQMQSAAPAAPAGGAGQKAEPKKDAEAEKKGEEEAASGLASLFG